MVSQFFEYLNFKQIGFLSPKLQIVTVIILVGLTALIYWKDSRSTGKIHGLYPYRKNIVFVALAEEVIFRGFLFAILASYSKFTIIGVSSIAFGLSHLRNYRYMTKKSLAGQIAYCTFIFGPIAGVLTILTGTIWLAVIIHYINNLCVRFFK